MSLWPSKKKLLCRRTFRMFFDAMRKQQCAESTLSIAIIKSNVFLGAYSTWTALISCFVNNPGYPAGRGVASIGDPVVESVRGPRNYSERGVATPAVLRMRCPSIARSTRGKNSCITSSPANDADLTTRPCATPSLRAESGQDCRGSRRIRRLLPCATPTAHGATPPIVGDGHSL